MNTKKIVAVAAIAALAIGIGATGKIASAQQQQDPEWKNSIGDAVTHAVLGEVQQEVANLSTRIAAAQTAAIAQKVDEKIQARLAKVQDKLQERLQAAQLDDDLVELEQAEAPRARVFLNGEDFSSADETGWLGVTPEDISADRAKELKLSTARGVYVSDVEKDSPAEKAGLKSGDVITEFNGQHVEGVTQFRRLVRETPPGHSVAIIVTRDGKSQTLNATLSTMSDQFQRRFRMNSGNGMENFTMRMPPMRDWNWEGPAIATPRVAPFPATPVPPGTYSFSTPDGAWGYGFGSGFGMGMTPSIGISGENLSGQLGTYFGAPDGEGILVREVESGSPAEKAGLKAGDVITKVGGNRVRTIGDLQSELREKRDDKTVQITVARHGSETNVTVEPNKPRTIAPTRLRGVA